MLHRIDHLFEIKQNLNNSQALTEQKIENFWTNMIIIMRGIEFMTV